MGTIVALNLIDLPTFEYQVVPAYSLYVGSSDTTKLIELLEKAIADYASVVGKIPDLPSREVFQEYSDILAGKIFYSSENIQSDQLHETSASDLKLLINTSIAPALMKIKCVPSNLPVVEQDMSHRHLMMYLYDHSRLVEDYFTFAREPSGSTPPIKLGEWSRFFSAEEVRKLDRELLSIPRPEDREVSNEGFDNLRTLVQTAAQRTDLGVMLTIL
jgi:hypothetical protein